MLRWAILGTGFISNTVVEAIAACPGSRVDIVAGRNADRVEEFREHHAIPRSCVGYAAAIADPDIDAVYIGTPNHQHHQLAIAAAQAGKAVLSEKALTTTMDSAHELADAVRGRVFFVEGLMYLAHPVIRRFAELLADPATGTVTSIHGRYAADISKLVNPAGRGTIYNLGCYPASLVHLTMLSAFGDLDGAAAFADRTMFAIGNRTTNPGALDTIGETSATIRFGNGVTAQLSSTDDYGMSSDFAVLTDMGELRFETNPWLPGAGDNVIVWTPFAARPDGSASSKRIVVRDDHDAFVHQIRLVENAVAAGLTEVERPSPRLDDSLAIMGLLTEWERLALDSSA